MASRIAGVLAVVGGTAWLVKFALIWHNGGTNTTEGLVGFLFDAGALTILTALAIRAWSVPRSGLVRYRLVAVLVFVAALAVAVDGPIVLGRMLFGRTWLAEEVGITLTAIAALVLGVRWVRSRPRTELSGTT